MSQTIELNGKRYDARTGKMLSAHQTVGTGTKAYVKPVVKQSGVALDGFAKRKAPANRATSPAHTAIHKKTERSKTLMRQVVKKPAPAKTKQAAPKIERAHQKHHVDIDPVRASRAKKVQKSTLVSKFGAPHKAITPVTSPLPVRPAPEAPPMPMLGEHHKSSLEQKIPAHKQAMQKALKHADSHHQAKAKKPTHRDRLSRRLRVSNRTVNLAAASLATVMLVGFIAYQNVPNLSMKIAATRAGVDGTLPNYRPSGFGLAGPISYQPGQITLSYKSHSDDRKFQVNQRASQWNSETLLENYVATDDKAFQTFQDSGKTIYIYDNNATWVDGGVWYQIEGNAALNSDQLLRMAASM